MVRQTVLAFGGLDILVSSAGLATSAPVTETTVDEWERNHAVLVRGYFLAAREAFRVLIKQGRGGSIVFVGSKNALVAGSNATAYSSAKAASLHLARCLAEEGGEHGIRVNTVNPDAVIEGSGIWSSEWKAERASTYGVAEEDLPAFYRNRTTLDVNVYRRGRRGGDRLSRVPPVGQVHGQRRQRRRRLQRRLSTMTTAPSTVDGAVERVPVLEMKGISKRFDATQALADVSLSLYPGETHALLGENGAGKSTLIKIMTGIHSPDAGEIVLRGEETTFKTSADAQRAGIAAIYQEPAIFPDLNVAENIFISHQDRGALVRWHRMYDQAEAILGRIDVRLDVRMLASGLTVASQQAVEIAKALSLDVRALIMDEPTAALSAHEVSELFTPDPPADGLRSRCALHQPPARRGLRDRRPGDRAPGRPPDLVAAAKRGHPGRCDPGNGRAGHVRVLRAHRSRAGRARPESRGARPGRRLLRT